MQKKREDQEAERKAKQEKERQRMEEVRRRREKQEEEVKRALAEKVRFRRGCPASSPQPLLRLLPSALFGSCGVRPFLASALVP